ncbi:MAG: hypothetical protein ACP5UZ_08025 [Thermoplasmata archaeon]
MFRSDNRSRNYQYIVSLMATWQLKETNMIVVKGEIIRNELCQFS